jgi:hypothetical protein
VHLRKLDEWKWFQRSIQSTVHKDHYSRSHGLVLEKQLPLSKQIHVQLEVAKQKKDPEPHQLAIGLLQCQWLVFSTEKIMLLVALPMQETGTCCVNY